MRFPFATNSFDLATSRFGVMFFREIDVALRELLRVCVRMRGRVLQRGDASSNRSGRARWAWFTGT
jgi:ubiquinone/menaquinone biosynthesis C-methylase UbiE